MIGQRVYPNPDGYYIFANFKPGDFFVFDGVWSAVTPNGHHCNLKAHTVTEHEDGTITVAPSIIVCGSNKQELWHGFIERGVWRTA